MLPAAARLPEARRLVEEGRYFVVHAPRQTGKTTTLAALARELTGESEYLALHFSCQRAAAAGDDFGTAERLILASIRDRAVYANLPAELMPPDPWPDATGGALLWAGLSAWASACPRPLALFFDEIDALRGASLISVLSQLRDGFEVKARGFPRSIVLCGLRDVRDYKAASGGDPDRLGTASPFNVKVASLRVEDFTLEQVVELYGQHTAATGQVFTKEAVQRAFEASQGQPWLVNALAYEITRRMGIASSEPITDEHMDEAVEQLILARATHLDSLVARLGEPRVQRLVEPMIAGSAPALDATYDDDVSYLCDLGLIRTRPLQIANPIYQEVIVRVLGAQAEHLVEAEPRSFTTSDGRLDLHRLLGEFTAFWIQHADILTNRHTYNEAGCQLAFFGYLHRVINGGGTVDREYAVGRGRIDLHIRWPYMTADGERAWQWEAIELKVHHPGQSDPLAEGLGQLDAYLDRLGLDTGTLIIFDRRPASPPLPERAAMTTAQTPSGRNITLLRL